MAYEEPASCCPDLARTCAVTCISVVQVHLKAQLFQRAPCTPAPVAQQGEHWFVQHHLANLHPPMSEHQQALECHHYLHLIPSSKERLGSLPWALWVRILHSAFKSNKQWDISLNNWSAIGIFSDTGCWDCSTCRICSFRQAFSSISLWFFGKSKEEKGES